MIDTLALLRQHILSKPAVTDLTGDRVWAGVTYPPGDYAPGQYAIVLNSRGGSISYDRRLLADSFTVKCYGPDELGAMTLYRVLTDAIDDTRAGALRQIELEIAGFPLQEQEPLNWPFVLCYFRAVYQSRIGE